jgi:tripartite-type tricarboxylate transporter receptor subunit TctC
MFNHLTTRKQFLHLAAGIAILPTISRFARAQAYPTRPVRLVVGFPAGGAGDTLARLIGQWLQERLDQPFIIEDRPGAANNIATEAVVRARPDGYTLLLAGDANAANASLYENLNFNFIRDIAPVAGIIRSSTVILVSPSFPAHTVPEFIAYARANPGKINAASPGTGTTQHLSGELLRIMTGIKIVHVPYRGGAPALTDLLGGQVQLYFGAIASSIEYIRAGKLRALAVTSTIRSETLPDVPSLSEFLPGFEAMSWFGIGAPRSTPAEIIDKLNKEINAALGDPRMKARFADIGGVVLPGSPADFGKLIGDETEKWAKVIRAANIKAE